MTDDKNFKRLIRERVERTGEPYAAARRALLNSAGGPNESPPARRIDMADWGFAITVPQSWQRVPTPPSGPELFRAESPPSGIPRLVVAKTRIGKGSLSRWVALREFELRAEGGATDVVTAMTTVGDRPAARTDYVIRPLAGPVLQCSSYSIAANPAGFVLTFFDTPNSDWCSDPIVQAFEVL